ncbi:hypothetical protein TNCV_3196191 [Trichonephila clavipes]|nr:hypothetical protein TNCV_3196191 [Trichonephila clavipes]
MASSVDTAKIIDEFARENSGRWNPGEFAHPGRCPQCQSDRLIYRPSIWYTRHGDGVDFSRAGLKEPMELGRRRGGPCADPLRSPISDYWGCERGLSKGF